MNVEAAIQALVDAGVEFVIIGGWSAILNGSGYITNDLDICYARNSENLLRLAQALAPYHPRLSDLPAGLPFVWDQATLRNGTVSTLNTDLGKIDLLAEVAGLGTFEELTTGSVATEAFGRQVRILNLKSLIKAKRAAGREKDLMMLPELESLLEAQEP
jgi:predicted nucleotidyltransferase